MVADTHSIDVYRHVQHTILLHCCYCGGCCGLLQQKTYQMPLLSPNWMCTLGWIVCHIQYSCDALHLIFQSLLGILLLVNSILFSISFSETSFFLFCSQMFKWVTRYMREKIKGWDTLIYTCRHMHKCVCMYVRITSVCVCGFCDEP